MQHEHTFLEAGRVLYWSLVRRKHNDPWLLSEQIPMCVRGRKMHPSQPCSPLHHSTPHLSSLGPLSNCHSITHLILPLQSLAQTKPPTHSMLGIGRVLRLNCFKLQKTKSLSVEIVFLLPHFILIYKLMFKKSRGEVVFNRGWFRKANIHIH